MKVALDATPLTALKSGIGEYTQQLALHLAKRFPGDEFLLISNFPFVPVLGTPNLRSLICPTNWISGRWWLFGLSRVLEQEEVSVFHGTNYDVPLVPLHSCLLTIHDLSSISLAHLHERRPARRVQRRLPWMGRVAAHVVTPTAAMREEIIHQLVLPREKVSVIPLAPGPQFRAGTDGVPEVLEKYGARQPYVLFVGTLEPRKNLLTLVRAFAALPDSLLRETQLVLCGRSGWKNEDLISEIRRLELESKLRRTGYVPDADLPALYRAAAVFVYPSLYEGFGLPPLEAMASGVPVIVSTAPALTEVLGDAAVRVGPFDIEALSQALEGLLTSSSLREEYRQKGLTHVQGFSWEAVAGRTHALYQKILAEHRPARWQRLYRSLLRSVSAVG